jgi:hypothetical protein
LKNFIPVGTAIGKVMPEKNGRSTAPVTNMWWAPLGDAVHREQLVVELVVHDLLSRECELGSHQRRQDPADQQPCERLIR